MFITFAIIVLVICSIKAFRAFDEMRGEGLDVLFWCSMSIYAAVCVSVAYFEKVPA